MGKTKDDPKMNKTRHMIKISQEIRFKTEPYDKQGNKYMFLKNNYPSFMKIEQQIVHCIDRDGLVVNSHCARLTVSKVEAERRIMLYVHIPRSNVQEESLTYQKYSKGLLKTLRQESHY